MNTRFDCAREWMGDGDRLLERANERLRAAGAELSALDREIIKHDLGKAAQLYLTGAIEYQQGREGVERTRVGPDTGLHLVQQLQGQLRREAEAAWRSSRHVSPDLERRSPDLEAARTFAESLRARFTHAAPELFLRGAGRESSRGKATICRTR